MLPICGKQVFHQTHISTSTTMRLTPQGLVYKSVTGKIRSKTYQAEHEYPLLYSKCNYLRGMGMKLTFSQYNLNQGCAKSLMPSESGTVFDKPTPKYDGIIYIHLVPHSVGKCLNQLLLPIYICSTAALSVLS